MRKLFYHFLFLCIFTGKISAQSCYMDSVVVQITDFHNYGDGTSIVTEHYDLLTGLCTHFGSSASQSPFSAPTMQTYPFIRNYIERTAFRDTLVYFGFQGTGTGFDNLLRVEFTYDANENPVNRLR